MKILFLVLAFTASAFAASAQTKEETVKWLESKLLEYTYFSGWNNLKVIANECEIKISFLEVSMSFATNFREINRKGEDGEETDTYYIHYDFIGHKRSVGSKHFSGKSELFLSGKTPPEMVARIEKALRHLASFCSKYQKSEDEPF